MKQSRTSEGKESQNSCEQCKKYGPLRTPMKIAEHIFVYGFCFKDMREKYGSAYPVYIPDSGTCKSFDRKRDKKGYEYEIPQEFKCSCCRNNLAESIMKLLQKGADEI